MRMKMELAATAIAPDVPVTSGQGPTKRQIVGWPFFASKDAKTLFFKPVITADKPSLQCV